jgi:hypothetical protein
LYGKRLIERLADNLTARMGRGFSNRSLEQYRRFYECYKEIAKAVPAQSLNVAERQVFRQAVPDQSQNVTSIISNILPAVTGELANRFVLGLTHYVSFIRQAFDGNREVICQNV